MLVDDVLVAQASRTADGKGYQGKDEDVVSAPTSGGLFIGGVPDNLRASVVSSMMTVSVAPFVGVIKDIAFTDES